MILPESQSPAPQPRRRDARVWLFFQGVGLVMCLPTLFAFGARYWSLCELLTHFRAYYVAALLPLSLLLVWRRKWWSAAICGAVLAYNVSLIVPLYVRHEQPASTSPHFRCLAANVHSANRDYERFLSYVHDETPDVLIVIEVNQQWIDALAPLKSEYPHSAAQPRSGNFGIAFFSRLPVKSIDFQEFGSSGVPTVVANVGVENGTVTIIGTHTLPPMTPKWIQIRNEQLTGIAEFVRKTDGPTIVMGDLNTTSWSPCFGDFVDASGLRDTRKGFGIQPTWTGDTWFMAIPIDHVLVSPDVTVLDRRVGKDIGSDHLPVVIDLGIADGSR